MHTSHPHTCIHSHTYDPSHFFIQYNPEPSRVLGVFGLSLYTGEKDLRDMFSKYGPVEEVQVVYDHQVINQGLKWAIGLCSS